MDDFKYEVLILCPVFQTAVALDLHVDAVLHQLPEEVTFHVGLHDAAGEVDGQHVFETDDGAVGAGRKGLSHVDIEPLDKGFHIRRDMQGAHIGQAGGGIFVLHSGIEGTHHQIFDEKGNHADQRVALGGGVGGDIAPQEFIVDIITHVMVDVLHDFFKLILTEPGVDGRIYHGDEIAQRLRGKEAA